MSDGRLAGGFGVQRSGLAQEGKGGSQAAGSHGQSQTGPSTADGPAVTMIHIGWQAVDEARVSGKVVAHTGCVRAQRDGAENP